MSSVRRKLFKEGSNSWASETIGEKQNSDEVENVSTELVEYTVVNEGDAAFKEQLVENPHGLKTPQESVFRRIASSFGENSKVKMARLHALSFCKAPRPNYNDKYCDEQVILKFL